MGEQVCDGYRLLSCDQHVEHPPVETWGSYVPEKHQHLLQDWGVGVGGIGDVWCNTAGVQRLEEVGFGKFNPNTEQVVGAYGGAKDYLEWLDLDQVEAAVIFAGANLMTNLGAKVKPVDPDGYREITKAYNNWLSDFCAEAPDRLLGCAIMPSTGLDDMLEELRRVRKLPGIRTVDPGSFPAGGSRPHPDDDQFWAECLKLDMPISLHGGLGTPFWITGAMSWEPIDFAYWLIGRIETVTSGVMACTQLILSGVFDRFPDLRFATAEHNASWVPFYLEQMDNNYQRHRHWAGFEIKAPPSSYCREGRFLWNVIQDDLAMQWRHLIGVDCMTWSSDFPHIVTEWPRSQWHVQRMMKDLPTDERHKICWANAARFYQLET